LLLLLLLEGALLLCLLPCAWPAHNCGCLTPAQRRGTYSSTATRARSGRWPRR